MSLVVGFTIALILLYFLRNRYSRGLNKFDGPFLASFTDVWKLWYAYHSSQKPSYVDIHKKYGDVVRIGPNNLSFADPQAIRDIYGPKGAPQKSEMYETTAVNTEGVKSVTLLATTNEKWHDQQRRLINAAFSVTSLLKYEPWVDDTIKVFTQQIRERFADKEGPEGNINLPEWLGFFAADVISELTFGQKTGFLETGKDVRGTLAGVHLIFRPWLYFSRMPILDKLTFKNPVLMWLNRRGFLNLPNPLREIVTKKFSEREQYWRDGKVEFDRETLTDRFLTVRRDLPSEIEFEPFKHSLGLIVAGSETTAITLSSIFYFLLKNPDCYANLEREINEIQFNDTSDCTTVPFATAQKLPYLNACINEAMRLHVVTRLPHDRVVPLTGLVVCGAAIPPGTDIGVHGQVIHRRVEIFGKDVEGFRPERWLGEEDKVRQMKNTLFTFSSGKYNCLGKNISRMEIAKFVPSIIRTFKISLSNPKRNWELIPGAFAIPTNFEVRMTMQGSHDSDAAGSKTDETPVKVYQA